MKLKKIKLENFRSYSKEEIEIPPGTSLFEGDIGSGKSSILYAIEFALFGMGDMRGENLLKAGKDRGSVELEFDIEGKGYIIKRSVIRKGDSISQNEGYIISEGRKTELSPSELRAMVLEILNFNENVKTRSSSVIFRYAIFTPQEEMKEILRLKSEDRLQTLRKAFGLEDYKTAKDNSKLVSDEMRTRIKYIDGEISDLESLASQFDENKKNAESFESKLGILNVRKTQLEDDLSKSLEEIKSLEGKRMEIEKISSEIPLLENELRGKKKDLENSLSEIETITKDIEAYEKRVDEFLKPGKPTGSQDEAKKEIEITKKDIESKSESMIELRSKIRNLEELMEKKVCPTCNSRIDIADYQQRVSTMTKNYDEIKGNLRSLKQRAEELQSLLKSIEEYERSQAEVKRATAEIDKLRMRMFRNSENTRELTARIGILEKDIPEKMEKAESSKEIIEKLRKMESSKRELDEKIRFIISETSQLSGKIKVLTETNERLEKMIREKQEQRAKKEIILQYQRWINEYFMPSIDSIEKQVLASINMEFDNLFRRWFSMLMEGSDINVRVDESFTPIVEQNGYEMPIESLSGGEKTSVAFSYRLALNLMVRKVTTSMKSNLLILDEPTDGFSKEQLFKVRDVLNELKSEQVILVSHERELESFVDSIFYVEKKGGVSSIRVK